MTTIEEMTIYTKIIKQREPVYADFPDTLNPELGTYLKSQGRTTRWMRIQLK